MLTASVVTTKHEIEQLLAIQAANLKQNVSAAEKQQQGFLKVEHTFDLLWQMHLQAPSLIVKDGNVVAGYALTMLTASKTLVPELVPMFEKFDQLYWQQHALNEYSYYRIGQIYIDKTYRGKGVFDMLYQHHKTVYQKLFQLLLTEISTSNQRSIRAHQRVGFVNIDTYKDNIDEWNVVLWNWLRNSSLFFSFQYSHRNSAYTN